MHQPTSRRTRRLLTAVVGFAALIGAACGSSSADTASSAGNAAPATSAAASATDTFPVELQGDNGPVTIAKAPTHIVSLSAAATEMLFAIGAGGQVIAVDDQSNYPPEAPKTDLSGFTPNLEAIIGKSPDLVIASNAPADLTDGLAKAKIPLLVLGAATQLEDTYSQLSELGRATGQSGGAEKTVADMRSKVDQIVASVPKRPKALTYYHELDDTLYTVTSKTFIGNVYSLVGLTNIADAADKDGSGYPQLSQEFLLQANPDLIFLADTKCCNQNAQSVAARPGWSTLKAVQSSSVVALDDDVASRWGPRVVDLLATVAAAVAKLPVTTQ